ncbi:MAG: hypothetical protein ACFFCW_44930, partial [Candidatus Hodarchaeota archaeon]
AMGAHPRARLDLDEWAKRLKEPKSADDWEKVFADHPEFFVIWRDPNDPSNASAMMRWRHAYDLYDPVANRELTGDEVEALSAAERARLTKKPLTADQIEALLKTAIELHSRSIAHSQEIRWLTPFLFGLLGAIIGMAGTILGAYLKWTTP